MSIDIEEIKKKLADGYRRITNVGGNIWLDDNSEIIEALEQQQDAIKARDDIIKGLIFECSTVGYNDAIIKKAEKLINWKLR